MADAVASQTLLDGNRNVVMKFTNISDGTGESAVTKVNMSALSAQAGTLTSLKVQWIRATTFGMGVDILWAGTPNLLIWHVPTDMDVYQDFREFGGLDNNAGTPTGDLKFTTVGHTSGDRYSIILGLAKEY